MAEFVISLCIITSLACAILLQRSHKNRRDERR